MQPPFQTFLEKFPNRKREELIPILQEVQSTYGWLSPEAISEIGKYLSISENKVFGVATFYDSFLFEPRGKYHVRICGGTGCHVCGGGGLLNDAISHLGINPGETDKQGLFSLEVVSCMGGCAFAPVLQVNDEFHVQMTKNKVEELIDSLMQKEKGIDET